jgi:TRAP-type C4-dicarboxylate transport system permease small subunit
MRRIISGLEKFLLYVATAGVFAIMCLVTGDATSRYLLSRGIFGVYEITEQFLMVISVFLALSYTYRRGAFIRVTFLVDRLPPRMKAALNGFVHLFSILLSFVFLWASINKTARMLVNGANIEVWSLPLWPAYLVVSVGFFLLTLTMILDIPKVISEGLQELKEFHEKGI